MRALSPSSPHSAYPSPQAAEKSHERDSTHTAAPVRAAARPRLPHGPRRLRRTRLRLVQQGTGVRRQADQRHPDHLRDEDTRRQARRPDRPQPDPMGHRPVRRPARPYRRGRGRHQAGGEGSAEEVSGTAMQGIGEHVSGGVVRRGQMGVQGLLVPEAAQALLAGEDPVEHVPGAVGFHDRMAVHQPQHAGRRERHGINVAGERHPGLRFVVRTGEPVPAHRAGRARRSRRDQPDRAERAHRVEHRPGRRGPSARPHRLDTARRAARLLVREHRAHVLLPLVRRQSGPAVMDAGRRHHVLPVGLHPYAG